MYIKESCNNIIDLYDDDDLFSWYSKLTGRYRIFRDRFGLGINKFSPWMVSNEVDRIPDGNINVTIEEALNEEIKRIYNMNKKIYIMWSGGVDSTSIICSFIQNGFDKSNIFILHSESSIEEYPLFYKFLLEQKWNLLKFDYFTLYDMLNTIISDDNNVLLSGIHGDKLYEGTFIRQYEFINWKQFLMECDGKHHIPIYEYILKSLDVKPYTTSDFLWVMNFVLSWNESLAFPFMRKNYILPFSTSTFQDICMQRFKTRNSYGSYEFENPKFYKPELKNIIFDVLKDEEYVNSKRKVYSFKQIKGFDKTEYKYYTYLWCDSGFISGNTFDSYEKKKFLKCWRKDSYRDE